MRYKKRRWTTRTRVLKNDSGFIRSVRKNKHHPSAPLSLPLPNHSRNPKSKFPPPALLLPSILLHPPTHPLHLRSLHLSLLALRRCLSLGANAIPLSPEEECRAWTALAEVGMRVIGGGFSEEAWAKGVEGNLLGKPYVSFYLE
jgi:hypothetical protein